MSNGRTWTQEQLRLLTERYPTTSPRELLALFPGRTLSAIKTKANELGLKKAGRFYFSKAQLAELREMYPNMSAEEIGAHFGCSMHTVYNAAQRLGLKKDPDFVSRRAAERMADPNHPGRKYHFPKGHVSANKGRKQVGYMTPEAIERTKATRFRKGNVPHNAKEDGSIIVRHRPERDEPPYQMIKVPGQRKLIFLHRHIWEKAHGPIPKGCNVVFRDGDTMNCELSNLELISNNELMTRNTLHRFPEEVRQLIHAKGALTRQINQQLKNTQ